MLAARWKPRGCKGKCRHTHTDTPLDGGGCEYKEPQTNFKNVHKSLTHHTHAAFQKHELGAPALAQRLTQANARHPEQPKPPTIRQAGDPANQPFWSTLPIASRRSQGGSWKSLGSSPRLTGRAFSHSSVPLRCSEGG